MTRRTLASLPKTLTELAADEKILEISNLTIHDGESRGAQESPKCQESRHSHTTEEEEYTVEEYTLASGEDGLQFSVEEITIHTDDEDLLLQSHEKAPLQRRTHRRCGRRKRTNARPSLETNFISTRAVIDGTTEGDDSSTVFEELVEEGTVEYIACDDQNYSWTVKHAATAATSGFKLRARTLSVASSITWLEGPDIIEVEVSDAENDDEDVDDDDSSVYDENYVKQDAAREEKAVID